MPQMGIESRTLEVLLLLSPAQTHNISKPDAEALKISIFLHIRHVDFAASFWALYAVSRLLGFADKL